MVFYGIFDPERWCTLTQALPLVEAIWVTGRPGRAVSHLAERSEAAKT